jgi:hypothetical protein
MCFPFILAAISHFKTLSFKDKYAMHLSVCFVWFYGTPTQFRSCGTETGMLILATL